MELYERVSCADVCCVVFFFKQKTAYEMRISDWSSDVCSSDLPDRTAATESASAPATGASDCESERGNVNRTAVRAVSVSIPRATSTWDASSLDRKSVV